MKYKSPIKKNVRCFSISTPFYINGTNSNTVPQEMSTSHGTASNTVSAQGEVPSSPYVPEYVPIPTRSDSAYTSDSDRLVRDYSIDRVAESEVYSRLTGRVVSPSELESTSRLPFTRLSAKRWCFIYRWFIRKI